MATSHFKLLTTYSLLTVFSS